MALSGAKTGIAGGPDDLTNEMLSSAPWSFHCVFHTLFQCRFQNAFEPDALKVDTLKHFIASWLRKDHDGDTLNSYRPLCRGSVSSKQFMRQLIGVTPFDRLVHRMPFWGFRPRLSSQLLCFALNCLICSSVQMANPNNVNAQFDFCCLQADVEKAFDKTRLTTECHLQ